MQVVLKKFGSGNNFIDWIKRLLTNQESCVINGSSTTSHLKLEKRARQGRHKKSIRELMKTIKLFSKFSGLKPNILKCEVAGIGSLKGVKMAVCGIKCIDLTTETIKILGVHFSYNQKLKTQKNFVKSTTNMQSVLNLWKMRNITLEGEKISSKH